MSAAGLTFWILGLFILVTGFLVIRSKNIVHSAYSLILCFLGVAGLYALLGFGFLALAQVLVYGGAISVLILFAIMTVMKPDVKNTNPSHPRRWGAAVIIGLMTLIGVRLIWTTTAREAMPALSTDSVSALADLFMGQYAIPLEVAALLLLVALIGAVILVKEE
jgi:NADH-quinone oxidoreductase subunit J